MNVPPYMSCHCFFTTPNDIQLKCMGEGLLTLTGFLDYKGIPVVYVNCTNESCQEKLFFMVHEFVCICLVSSTRSQILKFANAFNKLANIAELLSRKLNSSWL